jgi:hypothetical protein
MSLLKRIYRGFKYGKPIVVVSGLPRSGTSMLMKMLEAGGLESLSDGIREADEDNPKGYYELERVKDLDKGKDKSWLSEGRGKGVKIISFLLQDLPPDYAYKVVFVRRSLPEVIASQNKMLSRRDEAAETTDEKMIENFKAHLLRVEVALAHRSNFEVLYVNHRDVLSDPAEQARRMSRFIGGALDERKMAEVVDPALYRNREAEGQSG